MNGYYVAYLNNGYRFDFDKKCDQLDYSDPNLVAFRHIDRKAEKAILLAAIPYSNIAYILMMEKEGEK